MNKRVHLIFIVLLLLLNTITLLSVFTEIRVMSDDIIQSYEQRMSLVLISTLKFDILFIILLITEHGCELFLAG